MMHLLVGLAFVAQAGRRPMPKTKSEITVGRVLPKSLYTGDPSTNTTEREIQDLTCSCAGVQVYPERGEFIATNNNGGGGCVGSCGGSAWNFHRGAAPPDEMETVKSIQMWTWTGGDCGMRKICYTLTNDEAKCFGTASGPALCQFNFEPNDRIIEMYFHGNGYGTRFGRMQMQINRNGQVVSFDCGCGGDALKIDNAEGKQISGFFGRAGSDIDQLGILLVTPVCRIISQEIVAIECVEKTTHGNCLANWAPAGDDKFFTFESICNACDAPVGTTTCSFTFSFAQTHSVTTSSSDIDSLGGGVSFSDTVGESIMFEGIGVSNEFTTTVGVDYSHTWESSKSQTSQETVTIANTCTYNLPAGYAVKASGNTRMGNMIADMRMTVRTTTNCHDAPTDEVYDAQVDITDVALVAAISDCTYHGIDCDVDIRCKEYDNCQSCTADRECVWLNNEMCRSHHQKGEFDEETECISGTWKGVAVHDAVKNCKEAGYEYITNEGDCELASKDLGLTWKTSNRYYPAPQGCYGVPPDKNSITAQFSYAPENKDNGAVEYRYPICKDYGTASLTSQQAMKSLGSRAVRSCLYLGKAYAGNAVRQMTIENIRSCWFTCRMAGEKECSGMTWVRGAKLPCRHYKRKTIRRKGMKEKANALSLPVSCDPDYA